MVFSGVTKKGIVLIWNCLFGAGMQFEEMVSKLFTEISCVENTSIPVLGGAVSFRQTPSCSGAQLTARGRASSPRGSAEQT